MRYEMLIDGEWREAIGGGRWAVTNPATEETFVEVPYGDAADAEAAIVAAAAALSSWRARSVYERCAILARVGEAILDRLDELAPIMTQECGKPLAEARGEWMATAYHFEWFAEEGKRAYGRVIPPRNLGKRYLVIRQPVGVVASITAWNFPALLASRKWAPALAAGCTVIGRPSELTPLCSMAIANLLVEAGLPPGVLNLVNGDPAAQGAAFLASPQVAKVSFTGSQRVGRILMEGAAQNLQRLSLELGGSAPVLVCEDVDIDWAAAQAIAAKYRNNGQVCISPSRFYVQEPIYEDFLEATAAAADRLVLGNGLEQGVTTGPMVTAAGREKVQDFVADALEKGAQLVTGGARPASLEQGYFYEPTVMAQVTPAMKLGCDEVFGPVLAASTFETLDEGLALANSTPFGLAGYVLTHDMTTAVRAYEGLEFGIVGVNDLTPATPEAPFGGVKQSGFGRESGQEGLEGYLEPKLVSLGLT